MFNIKELTPIISIIQISNPFNNSFIDELEKPMVMDFDNYGNLYIQEFTMNRIRSFDNVILESIVKNPMAVHVKGNILYIADT